MRVDVFSQKLKEDLSTHITTFLQWRTRVLKTRQRERESCHARAGKGRGSKDVIRIASVPAEADEPPHRGCGVVVAASWNGGVSSFVKTVIDTPLINNRVGILHLDVASELRAGASPTDILTDFMLPSGRWPSSIRKNNSIHPVLIVTNLHAIPSQTRSSLMREWGDFMTKRSDPTQRAFPIFLWHGPERTKFLPCCAKVYINPYRPRVRNLVLKHMVELGNAEGPRSLRLEPGDLPSSLRVASHIIKYASLGIAVPKTTDDDNSELQEGGAMKAMWSAHEHHLALASPRRAGNDMRDTRALSSCYQLMGPGEWTSVWHCGHSSMWTPQFWNHRRWAPLALHHETTMLECLGEFHRGYDICGGSLALARATLLEKTVSQELGARNRREMPFRMPVTPSLVSLGGSTRLCRDPVSLSLIKHPQQDHIVSGGRWSLPWDPGASPIALPRSLVRGDVSHQIRCFVSFIAKGLFDNLFRGKPMKNEPALLAVVTRVFGEATLDILHHTAAGS
jgi:hypothetical protein